MIFPLQRVLIELPVLLVRHVSFLSRNKTFVNVLDLDLTFSCVHRHKFPCTGWKL